MRIPKFDGKKGSVSLGRWANEIINECSASRPSRILNGSAFKNLYLTGDEQSDPATYNKTFAYIDNLSSYLYSPVNLRFGIEFFRGAGPVDRALGRASEAELNSWIRASNLDTKLESAVTWALVKGKCVIKLVWGEDGLEPYLVQPEQMGVLQEDISSLDRQQAFFHSSFLTPSQLRLMIQGHPEAAAIERAAIAQTGKAKDDAGYGNVLKQVVLGGLNPYQAAGTNTTTQNKGVVNWLNAPYPYLAPEVLTSLIRLDELWIKDDDREGDWTTIQVVGDSVVFGREQHRNLFADPLDFANKKRNLPPDPTNPLRGYHGFIEICPNEMDGYFWGRSELCNVALLQKSMNQRINGINKLLRLQENPPRALMGGTDIGQKKISQSRKPGGWLAEPNPNAKIQSLAPDLPENLWLDLKELEKMFDQMAGFPPVMQGLGDSGVRSADHAETLVSTASPRFKNRALVVERQVGSAGALVLDVLKAKIAEPMTAWLLPKDLPKTYVELTDFMTEPPAPDMKPLQFLLSQFKGNYKVVVDSHSSSPAFAAETRQLLFALAKAGAVSKEQLITHTNPPGADEMIADNERKDIEQGKLIAQHPELAFPKGRGKKS